MKSASTRNQVDAELREIERVGKRTPRIGSPPNVGFDFSVLGTGENGKGPSNVTLYDGRGGIIQRWAGVYCVGFMNGTVSFSLDKPDCCGRTKKDVTIIGTVVVESEK